MCDNDVGTLAQIIGVFLQVCSLIPRDKTNRSYHQEKTLRALSKAYHDTEKYYAYLNAGNSKNQQMEYDIAYEWETASTFVNRYNSTYAQQLGLKSRFWREGAAWTPEQIAQAGIQLDRVRAEGMSLLNS